MKIARFAHLVPLAVLTVLTGAAATGGCHIYVDEPAKTAPPPPTSAPVAQQAAPAAPSQPAKVVPMHLHTNPTAPGTTPVTPSAPAAGCLDSTAATVADCATLSNPVGCTMTPGIQQRCNAYKAYFSPKVAAAAVSCLASLSGTQACDATHAAACGRTALAQSCPAPAIAQLCQIAATSCKTTAADCTSSLSGLNDQGQQAVAQCVAQGCTAGLSACIDGLGASAAVAAKH
jgi:hypothetical protein